MLAERKRETSDVTPQRLEINGALRFLVTYICIICDKSKTYEICLNVTLLELSNFSINLQKLIS